MSSQNNNLDKIEHIVVLMMENRSFDNVLGRLYPDDPDFNGVKDSMSNPRPDGELAYVFAGTDMTAPFPDPNEPYDYVYMQQFNPPSSPESVPPFPPPCPIPLTTATPSMQGFVLDYVNALSQANQEAAKHGRPPFDVDPGVIMNCFAPTSLPVINGLAKAYAVCDSWYSSVPTQTFPNRSFVHAATSSGNVYNTWGGEHFWDKGIFINNTPTIYNLLEAANISWKIYHGGPLLLCNALYGQRHLWEFLVSPENRRFFPLQSGDYSSHPDTQANQFLADVQAGTLPAYTFIEPNMICSERYGPENDMHPAFAVFDTGAPTNALYGDKLIYDIYTALRESDYWEKTLFVITFDEHGGCFDHQPPPPAVSPDGIVIEANKECDGQGSNFDFRRLGVRVPAVLVSPWIEQGTICHTQFDHTSIIKTASNKWLRGQNLTERDANALDVSEVLTLTAARTDAPEITPVTPPPFTGCGSEMLSGLHRDMLVAAAMLIARKADRYLHLGSLKTRAEIIAVLDKWGGSFLAA
jgi:phospholipase C